MGMYLFEAKYTTEGTKGLLKQGGTGRRTALEKLFSGMGGKLLDLYYAFGDVDVYVVTELPDNETAAAVALAVNNSGLVTTRTVVLMSPEDMDKACHKTVNYSPPK
ncbi:MAG: GYD domain-containing protein [Casimicrobiaceae bacterium]